MALAYGIGRRKFGCTEISAGDAWEEILPEKYGIKKDDWYVISDTYEFGQDREDGIEKAINYIENIS